MGRATLFFFSTKIYNKLLLTKKILSNRQVHSDANNLKVRLFSLDLEFRRASLSFILIENYHLKQTANTHFLDCCTVLSIAISFSIAALRSLLYIQKTNKLNCTQTSVNELPQCWNWQNCQDCNRTK